MVMNATFLAESSADRFNLLPDYFVGGGASNCAQYNVVLKVF